MKISLNWIKDYVDLEGIDIKELWYRFTMSTAEVEDVEFVGQDIKNVVVAKVLSVNPHPESKKLKITQVDSGDGVIQIVCGAPNVAEGILVPLVKIGGSVCKIPKIGKAKLVGVESFGMLCSASELGISDDHSGLLVLEGDYAPGTDIKSIIDIDDVIIEIDNKSLTNRPDLWGHYGIAREIAAIYGRELKPMNLDSLEGSEDKAKLDITVEDTEKCLRYSGLKIDGVKKLETPMNMKVRLFYCGMRSISPLVDLTNYLMLEMGQPMHAFDSRQVESGIVVRSTKETTPFTTLDGVERKLPEDALLICTKERPVAIAGIMGGENSEVLEDTTSILLESATFEGSSTRKSSTKIGLRTEASARYEKMLDPNMTVQAIQRFVKLLRDIQPDIQFTSALTDVYCNELEPIDIEITKPYIDKYIGNTLTTEKMVEILRALEFKVDVDGDTFRIKVPTFRATKDITMKVDIIEEITRVFGYDNIQPQTLDIALKPLQYNEERLLDHKIKELLSERFGASEVNSYIWYDNTFNSRAGIETNAQVKVLNPQAQDSNTLRDSMVPGMLSFAEKNEKTYDDFSLFEIGSVFKAETSKEKCEQHKNICILVASKIKSEDELFYELKGMLSFIAKTLKNVDFEYTACTSGYNWVHPMKSVDVSYNGNMMGYIAAVHPMIKKNIGKKLNIAVLEINRDVLQSIEQKLFKYKEPSKYPEVLLDYSFLVDNSVTFDKLMQDIRGFKSKVLNGFEFVTIYNGKGLPEGKKSMTFRFVIGSDEKTLSSEDINEFANSLLNYMAEVGYTLR
ncbi:phenylalanyl-tRNA synthetase, beta subunit [Ruminiclostridium papyrosolvens DSM 2782]|uniref:Phenylalanine--tRNA ligase beta subunit n=1 Tax=Ruminiclostridium papyrosolvens DSM 2782 TaxID=588581 RepID=F1T9M6_9FIRM|nr:phenylalanine--tRNA ligase subunit beta [Ruminiclostridium papyrosolvens]EGD49208.1 phenylalanyl-tRNA synthetase, beta subunit [Ruminiclostridium papyrosolvens DSM 2782]WES35686.1 phenylalanine--tRNA ligase subunit beta [Ruminiclostridium papyrosolvens DSM 2782]